MLYNVHTTFLDDIIIHVLTSGEMGMLYVDPLHRGKGLAKAAVGLLASKLVKRRKPIFCFAKTDASIKIHLACGFRIRDEWSYQCATFLPPGTNVQGAIEL